MCALSEAEHHCDSAICRLLINKAHADTGALDQIKLPRDVRIWKMQRSPTPEMLFASPRKKSIKRNTEVLSPLVVNCGRQVSDASTNKDTSEVGDRDDLESSLSDVQEEGEESNQEEGYPLNYGQLSKRSRKSSNSLPDLRSRVCLVAAAGGSGGGGGGGTSSTAQSPCSDEGTVPRFERRITQHTLDDLSLPLLSEEEEDEYEEDVEEGANDALDNSLSLPDLTKPFNGHHQKHVTVAKKANGSYVTMRGTNHITNLDEPESRARGLVAEDSSSTTSSLRLPHLNLSYQIGLPGVKIETRSGFQGNHAPFIRQSGSGRSARKTIDKTLKMMGNKNRSPTSTQR